ncbi:MAG TPA: glutamate--tRNA ligase family protein [Mucilaginibacter sp.]|nr:glutamate--tRNA ligase family protein [Mucilaginibacter sp.]
MTEQTLDHRNGHFSKTRIAPTPSGYLHLGNVLSFALTAFLAEQTGAKILLRIDDLDRERAQKPYIRDIFDTLNFMGIPWDDGPRNDDEFEKEWSQVHRLPLYGDALQRLHDCGDIFACDCSRTQIRNVNADDVYPGTCRDKNMPLDTPGVAWRLRTDSNMMLKMKALSGETTNAHLPPGMKDFIIRKKDGYPAYQLSSVVDDLHFGIDLIVRGYDLLSSTQAQLYLASKLGEGCFERITFYHHKLLETSGKKLSKSAGDTSVKYLREQGKKPVDVYTLIAEMLGLTTPATDWKELAQAFFSTYPQY